MKTYRVWAKITSYAYIDIEAESAQEAEFMAENTDGGDFIPSENDGDWEIICDKTEEVES